MIRPGSLFFRLLFTSAALPVISAFTFSAHAEVNMDYPDWRQQLGEPNPASLHFYGEGRLQLPSVRFDVGSTLSTDRLIEDSSALGDAFQNVVQDLSGSGDTTTDTLALRGSIDGFLGQFEAPARLDYDLDVNFLGFGGAPFTQLQINQRPLSLGMSLSSNTRGYLQATFSEAFNDNLRTLTTSLPALFSEESGIPQITQTAQTVGTQVVDLTQDINTLLASVQRFQQNPGNNSQAQVIGLNQQLTDVNGQVRSLLTPARQLTALVGSATSASRSLLSTLDSFSGGGAQIIAAADTHFTLGFSGAYPVYESEDIQVALGARVKLFMMPFNVPLEDLNIQSQAGLFGKLALTEVTGLKRAEELRATLDTFDQTVTSVNQVLDQAERVSQGVEQVQTQLSNNNLAEAAAQGVALAQDGAQLASGLNTVQTRVQEATRELQTVQNTLLSEFQDIAYKGTLTTPSGAGVGLDVGIDALLYRYLRLGLQVQNPVVLWPGTERPFEGRFVRSQNGQIQVQPSLNVSDAEGTPVNYTATVPVTVLFNARYRFDGVLQNFPGLYGISRFEYVANGRTPAVQLGLQKFFNDTAYAGLGGRLGGVGSLVYLEGGLNPLDGFILNAQLGISPAGQGLPIQGLGWLGLAQLGLAYRF